MNSVEVHCPDGHPIMGSSETIAGTAYVAFYRGADGFLLYEYEGETKIDWDSQEAKQRDGENLFVCWDGDEFKFSELDAIDGEAEGGEPVVVTEVGSVPRGGAGGGGQATGPGIEIVRVAVPGITSHAGSGTWIKPEGVNSVTISDLLRESVYEEKALDESIERIVSREDDHDYHSDLGGEG